ncbi:hypothetical protein TNCT_541531, partial [Trichonephila clavata]
YGQFRKKTCLDIQKKRLGGILELSKSNEGKGFVNRAVKDVQNLLNQLYWNLILELSKSNEGKGFVNRAVKDVQNLLAEEEIGEMNLVGITSKM